jgi:hypothetical protein
MKRTLLAIAGVALLAATQGLAQTKTELVIDDETSGLTADITVDSAGTVTCTGTCAGLTISYDLSTAHGTLSVTGNIGIFHIASIGAIGGLDEFGSGRQDLNQVDATASAAGSLFVGFSDTDYGLAGGGGAFGTNFLLTASQSTSTTPSSTVFYAALADGGDGLFTGTLISPLAWATTGFTGTNNSASFIAANPVGPTGSLSTESLFSFNGAGQENSGFEISTTSVPEPASISLFGAVLSFAAMKLRRRKTSV